MMHPVLLSLFNFTELVGNCQFSFFIEAVNLLWIDR